MRSRISPVLANVILNRLEYSFLSSYPENIKSSFYRRYLDNTFLLFNTEEQAHRSFKYINNVHNISKLHLKGKLIIG